MFIGTFENKIDRKGRVSVPAQFRRRLEGQSFHGIVAFPSHTEPCIEACGMDHFERLTEQMLQNYDQFSPQLGALLKRFHGLAAELPFDTDGRIILPPKLLEHAKITEQVSFVGNGPRFQIWEPATADKQMESALQQAEGLTISFGASQGTPA